MKQGSRGVKTAYKDLKSKLRDKTPPHAVGNGGTSSNTNLAGMATGSGLQQHHHSAPNSPVFTKRPLSELTSSPMHHYTSSSGSKQTTNSSRTMLQTSNSLMNNSNYANNNNNNNNNHDHDHHHHHLHMDDENGSSPAISPTSSISSSEMNILQELQQHALFKLPTVDRSVSFFVIFFVVTVFFSVIVG